MVRALIWAFLPAAIMAGSLLADDNVSKEAVPPEMDLRFLDGSSARVFLVQSSLELETKYGKLTFPCRDIRKIELSMRLSDENRTRIDEAVRQLGSKEFGQREAASKELFRFAVPAYHVLKANRGNKDPEVARRVEALLKQIESAVPAQRLQARTDDLVQTKEFTVSGRVTAEKVKVRSRHFGETELKIADLTSLNSLAGKVTAGTPSFAGGTELFRAAFLLEVGDYVAAKQAAETFAKGKQVDDLAVHFRNRRAGRPGLGIGPRPGLIQPDGIEQMVLFLADDRRPLDSLLKTYSEDLSGAFYLTAAIGEAHRMHCPVKQKTKRKDPLDWERWSVELRDHALQLARAAQTRHPVNVRNAAKKLSNTCNSCHDVFRDCS